MGRIELNYFDNINIMNLDKYQTTPHQWISYNNINMYTEIDNLYNNSYFSLQPHGDKQTRKGFYHSLLMGCIPVVFENNYQVYEDIFKKYVKITDICVVIKNSEIKIINKILENKIKDIPEMIKSINTIKHLLLYPETTNDIFLEYLFEQIH
jgi:hypothetical protein